MPFLFIKEMKDASCVSSMGTARKERSHVFWERFTLGVQHIVNKGHWPEWPKDQEWSGIFLRSAAESFTPVARRSSVTQTGLLHLEQPRIDWREVSKANHEVKRVLVVLAFCVEARVDQELVKQRSDTVRVKQILLC
jgi:hypothetical protein